MKHLSHHIIGDTKYGRGEHNKMVRQYYNCNRLLLHAFSLEIKHPYTNKQLIFKAKTDETFNLFLNLFSHSLEL